MRPERYRVGWKMHSAGGRKRRTAVLAAGTRMGSLGREANTGAVGYGNGR